jgi:hypothetical protein
VQHGYTGFGRTGKERPNKTHKQGERADLDTDESGIFYGEESAEALRIIAFGGSRR